MVEEDEDEPEIKYEVTFAVKVLKVPDQDIWAVEFTREKGDILVFNRIYNDA